jgi:hypothetical protein
VNVRYKNIRIIVENANPDPIFTRLKAFPSTFDERCIVRMARDTRKLGISLFPVSQLNDDCSDNSWYLKDDP